MGSVLKYNSEGYSTIDYQSGDENKEHEGAPERALLAAILERAISDAMGATGRGEGALTQKRGAYYWIVSSDPELDSKEPFSFCWICEQLGFDSVAMKDAVVKARDSGRQYIRDGRGRVRVEPPLVQFAG